MKTILLSLILITSSSQVHSDEKSCVPPGGVKALEDCCNVPVLFEDHAVMSCEALCKKNQQDGCVQRCLLTNNGVIKKDVVNTTAIEVLYNRLGLGSKKWLNITSNGLQKCKLDLTKSFKEMLESFEDCMNFHFESNCVEFNDPVECDKVEDFMESCLKVEENCEEWPVWVVRLPENCCPNPPELFPQKDETAAEQKCEDDKSVISNLGKEECKAGLMLESSGIRKGNDWDFTIVTKLLTEHAKDPAKWKSAIESSVKTCEIQVQTDIKAGKSDGQVNFWFYICIKGSLADFCPEYDESQKRCRRIKKYKEKCPNSVPPRRSYMNNGRMN